MAPVDSSTAPRSSMGFIHDVLSADVPAPRRMHTLELEERPMPPAGPASVALKTGGRRAPGASKSPRRIIRRSL